MKRQRLLSGILTVRLDAPLRARLERRARARGETPSTLVREILERALEEGGQPSRSELAEQFLGIIRSGRVPRGSQAREALARWSPDRRG